jgi:hypothetical protein
MKRLAALLLVAGSMSLGAQTAAPLDPLASVAWMAGGVWHGEVRGPDGKTSKIETKVVWELNGRALSFSSSFDGVMQYSGFYAYDAAKKSVIFSYPSADGGLANGTVEQRAGFQLWDLQLTESNGSVKHFQVHTHQDGPDDYTWALFSPQKDSWVQLFEIHYHRAQS